MEAWKRTKTVFEYAETPYTYPVAKKRITTPTKQYGPHRSSSRSLCKSWKHRLSGTPPHLGTHAADSACRAYYALANPSSDPGTARTAPRP